MVENREGSIMFDFNVINSVGFFCAEIVHFDKIFLFVCWNELSFKAAVFIKKGSHDHMYLKGVACRDDPTENDCQTPQSSLALLRFIVFQLIVLILRA